MKRAQELDPFSLAINNDLGWTLYLARQYDQVIEQSQKTLELDSNFFMPRWHLGYAYLAKGMYDKAIVETQKAVDLSKGNLFVVGTLGYIYGMSGKKEEAQKILQALRERSKQEDVSPLAFAWVYTGLDEKDQAFGWLEKAYEERTTFMIFNLKPAPFYDNLRSDPRYMELLKKMNLD